MKFKFVRMFEKFNHMDPCNSKRIMHYKLDINENCI